MVGRLFSLVGEAIPVLIFAYLSTYAMTKSYFPELVIYATWLIALGWIFELGRRNFRRS